MSGPSDFVEKPLAKGTVSNKKLEIMLQEKLFSWSGDSFKIKLADGTPLGNGLKIKGKALSLRDQMAILDADDRLIAVLFRKFQVVSEGFKIYRPEPCFEGQSPSDRTFGDKRISLYALCEIKRLPLSSEQQVWFERPGGRKRNAYNVVRTGLIPKERTIFRASKPVARVGGGTFGFDWNSYKITVEPGTDPVLMICLTAACDEMDE